MEEKQQALRGYQVRVSNDGRLWSTPTSFIVYDGACIQCKADSQMCIIKVSKICLTILYVAIH